MSRHTLDLRRSAQIVWRHKFLVGGITALGLICNVAYTMVQQPVFTSNTLVVLSPSVNVSTQTVVVRSVPVLAAALPHTDSGLSLQTLQTVVQATRAADHMISISAHGSTAVSAERTANAVTASYIAYITSARNSLGSQPALLLQAANTATAKPFTTRVLEAAGFGTLAGALIALIAALAIWRADPRLRERDAIADSIGVPVLASVSAKSPADVPGWAKLLEQYEPRAVEARLLRTVLRDLRTGGSSVTVLSLANDRDALALGPQLAAFAAAQDIPTTVVVGPPQAAQGASAKSMAALRAACKDLSARAGRNLQFVVLDDDSDGQPPRGALTICVAVVDAGTPRVAEAARAALTVLGVTAGAVTAEQLTLVAASAAADGRDLAGILVANPAPADQTTGRVPQLGRPEENRMPTRMVGVVTESRR